MWATPEVRQRIANMLTHGASAAQIGSVFRVTRNAVIGIVSRDASLKAIGFARSPGQRKDGQPKRQRREVSPRYRLPFEVPPPPARPVITGTPHCVGLPMASLRPNQCKFSVNDAGPHETHLFCAMPSDGAWCPHHRRLVYRPAEKRKAA